MQNSSLLKKDGDCRHEKKQIAGLILKVLNGEICVREALKKFPSKMDEDYLQCVWHALVHFEADEDFRKKDIEYAQEQDNYLKNMALMLQSGEFLPENIIEEYNKFYEPVIKSETKSIFSRIKSIFRFII